MNCNAVQTAIVRRGDDPLPDNVTGHLANCPECRAFRQTMQRALESRAFGSGPSPDLDRRILRLARGRVRPPVSGPRPIAVPELRTRQAWIAVAALLLFAASLGIVWLRTVRPADGTHPRPIAKADWANVQFEEDVALLYAEIELMQLDHTFAAYQADWLLDTGPPLPPDAELQRVFEQLYDADGIQPNGT